MPTPTELYERAVRHYQSGDRVQAERACWDLLAAAPLHQEAVYMLGVLALEGGQHDRSLLHLHHAMLLRPGDPTRHQALGEAWRMRGETDHALACFEQALAIDPGFLNARHALGLALLDRGRPEAAEAAFRAVLEVRPDHERAQLNLGRALQAQGRIDEAADCFAAAARLRPGYAMAHNNLGAVLLGLGRIDEALAALRRAVELEPNYAEARANLGHALNAVGDPTGAREHLAAALRLRPGYARAQAGLARALESLGRLAEACAAWREAVRLDPADAESWERLGDLLLLQPDWHGARAAFESALRLKPESDSAFARLAYSHQMACDWQNRDAELDRLWADAACKLDAGQPTAVVPFQALTLPWSAGCQLAVARSHSRAIERNMAELRRTLGFRHSRKRDGRLRVGYLSGDFYSHPIAFLIQGLFGLHDRGGFEVFAYSFGPRDGGEHRRRIVAGCDHFRDINELATADAARAIADDGLHILVDLMGYTGQNRISLLALRPAPVQVSFLGMVGTTGASFLDYLVADRIVAPPGTEADYDERLVRMPHTYMVTDSSRPIPATTATRASCGLPEPAVVFCCFNNAYKIDPSVFEDWMAILAAVPEAVLWLYAPDPAVVTNLRREAAARGIEPSRLVFEAHVPLDEYLARHRLADLFLDTPLYNGHSTVALALWAGLPVLTRPGATFASRVASSLLKAAGLPDLIASDREAYRSMAVRLARDPAERGRFRDRLVQNRAASPLFDTAGFARHLEHAYREMWDTDAAGDAPRPIEVGGS